MKTFFTLFITALTLTGIVHASENEMKIHYKTISPQELEQPENALFKNVLGSLHYLTIISIESLPPGTEMRAHTKRPFFENLKHNYDEACAISKEQLLNSIKFSRNGLPFHMVQGMGFYPGEEVEFYFEEDGLKSNVIKFFPYPIIAKSKKDNASITVKYNYPGLYHVEFSNFLPNEEVTFKSVSYEEILENKMTISSNIATSYMPGVIGKDGGVSIISIKRANGETLRTEVPWGTESVNKALKGFKPK